MLFKILRFNLPIVISFIICFSNISYSQKKSDRDKVSDNEKAIFYFIEGKTLELKNNYIQAVENFRTALKYDKAPGIYHALAEVYFKLSKYDEALIEITNALNLDSDNPNYLEILSNIYIARKDFAKAANTYEKILSLDSTYTYGLYSLARLYQELKMPAKAIVIYEKITSKLGYDFDVLNKMYDIYINYRDYVKAAEVLENILTIDPYNIEIKKLLASLYLKNDQQEDARKVFEEIFTLNPDDKGVQTELVKIYFKQNESDKAFENFGRMLGKDSLGYWEKVQIGELYYNLISQDRSSMEIAKSIFTSLNNEYPDHWIPYYYLGAIDVLNKNENDYKEKFLKAIEFADTSREVYINVGFLYYQEGAVNEALVTLDQGLSKFPDDYRLNYIKGLTLQRGNKEADAIPFFEKAIDLNPNDVGVLSTLALAYDNQGFYIKSEEMYERALRIDPENPLTLNNYAYNLSERNTKLESALSMSKIAVGKDPGNASYLDTIGWIYFKLKKYKLAKEFIEKSLAVNGNSAVVLEHLGDIYSAMNDNINAVKYWQLSIEKNPVNKSLREKIEATRIG
ncbi:MAG: tetratricopeptide repeat protein [Ignavibacteria bacterium]